MSGRESECAIVPTKAGNRPMGPDGGKGTPRFGTAGGKDDRNIEFGRHLNETTADSDAGAAITGHGVDEPCPPHRHRMAERSVSSDTEGWRRRRGRQHGEGLRSGPASQSGYA